MSNKQLAILLIAHYSLLIKNGYPYQTKNLTGNPRISANTGRGGEAGDCALLLSRDFSGWKFDSDLAIYFFG